jgi:hypothetical protein
MGKVKRRAALVDAVDRILREDLAGRILHFDSAAAQSYATTATATARALLGDRSPRPLARSQPLHTPVVPPSPRAIRVT